MQWMLIVNGGTIIMIIVSHSVIKQYISLWKIKTDSVSIQWWLEMNTPPWGVKSRKPPVASRTASLFTGPLRRPPDYRGVARPAQIIAQINRTQVNLKKIDILIRSYAFVFRGRSPVEEWPKWPFSWIKQKAN